MAKKNKKNAARELIMAQVEQGRKIALRAYTHRVEGFTEGMRVVHQTYGNGEIIIAEECDVTIQSYWMKLDISIPLGGGDRLNNVWVWPGHLKKEEIVEDKKTKIKSKIKKEKVVDAKPKRKRKTRKKK
ncbi:MAG TPA: hypothetical protein EYQ86_06800 [Bacteroidetes bacterium]|jgi:hypothetical protein|nr:hypothetical protein [Bacteroidota bacterium]